VLPQPVDLTKGLVFQYEVCGSCIAAARLVAQAHATMPLLPRTPPPAAAHLPIPSALLQVKLSEGHTCGGAYIKLLAAAEGFSGADLGGDTPYTIMFGPDRCGQQARVSERAGNGDPVVNSRPLETAGTGMLCCRPLGRGWGAGMQVRDTQASSGCRRPPGVLPGAMQVHLIFRHTNHRTGATEERHLQTVVAPPQDPATHAYTLVVTPDNTFIVGAAVWVWV